MPFGGGGYGVGAYGGLAGIPPPFDSVAVKDSSYVHGIAGDAITVVDNARPHSSPGHLLDSVAVADFDVRGLAKRATDIVAITDSSTEHEGHLRALTDTVSVAATVGMALHTHLNATDSISVTDRNTGYPGRWSVALTDMVLVLESVKGTPGHNTETARDAVAVGDGEGSYPARDMVTVSDVISFTKDYQFAADAVATADLAALRGLHTHLAALDSVTESDSVRPIGLHAHLTSIDTVGVVEETHFLKLLSQDQVTILDGSSERYSWKPGHPHVPNPHKPPYLLVGWHYSGALSPRHCGDFEHV